MAHSKKRTHRQSTEVFDFDRVAIAMEAMEEVTRATIDLIVLNSQQATTGDISPATDPTQPADNERGSHYNEQAKASARSQKETTTRLGQSSVGPSNHMEGTDVHRGQLAASLQTKSASMAEYRNTIARVLEECERAIERNTSLKEELVIAQYKIAELEKRCVETSYLSICNDFKLAAASHRSPQFFYEHLKSIFDSYVNPDNNPDNQPLVKALDEEDFDVDAFLGTNIGGRKEEMTPDFLDVLFVHDARRLESEI
ncbi:hypothetical protein R1flu_021283 [Riccia fluitans]|uniref:Uncharacterized protein n=1 Tax=Riccia fluitans TaxID=41844 RepID=A0ABD1ZP93_9MARC